MIAAIRPSQHSSPTTSRAGAAVVPPATGHGTQHGDDRARDTAAQRDDRHDDRAALELGLALDATSDAFLLLDENGIVRGANANASRMFGRPGESLSGSPFLDLVSASAAAAVRPALEAAARGIQHSTDFPLGDDQTWYIAHVYPVPGGTFLHLHDVTDRHNAREGLAFLARAGKALTPVIEERRLWRIVGRLAVPYLADWCLVMLHQEGGAPRLAASAKNRMLRRRLLAVAERERERGAGGQASAFLSLPPRGESVMLRRPAPTAPAPSAGLWSLASSIVKVPLIHAEGVVGLLVLGRADGRRRFRRTDVQLATALGSRVATVLDRVRLYEAEQRAIRLRDDVLAIVAHDLRNPLHGIMLAATALATRPADHQVLHQAAREAILTAAEQMHHLVEDLLDAARLDADWGPQECVIVDVAELMEASAKAFRWRAERGGVRLETVSRGGRRMRMEADAGRLTQAVENLLDNAIKFTPSGGTVTLTSERVPEGIQLSVADTGPGIDPEAMPRLFDRFWQARKSGRASAGLGLFIARRIVEGHGGRLTAESGLGEGSVFRIVLPTRAPGRDAVRQRTRKRERPWES